MWHQVYSIIFWPIRKWPWLWQVKEELKIVKHFTGLRSKYLDISTNDYQPSQTGWGKTVLLPKRAETSDKLQSFHSSSSSKTFYGYFHPVMHGTLGTYILHPYLGLFLWNISHILIFCNFGSFNAFCPFFVLQGKQKCKKNRQSQMPGFSQQLPMQRLLPLFNKISGSKLKPDSFPTYLCKNCLFLETPLATPVSPYIVADLANFIDICRAATILPIGWEEQPTQSSAIYTFYCNCIMNMLSFSHWKLGICQNICHCEPLLERWFWLTLQPFLEPAEQNVTRHSIEPLPIVVWEVLHLATTCLLCRYTLHLA